MVTHEGKQRPSKELSTVMWCPVFITVPSCIDTENMDSNIHVLLGRNDEQTGEDGVEGWKQNKKEKGLKEDKYNEIHISAYQAETSKAKGSREGGRDRGEIIYKGNHLMDTRFLLCCSRCQKAVKSYLQSAEGKQPLNLYIRQNYARME